MLSSLKVQVTGSRNHLGSPLGLQIPGSAHTCETVGGELPGSAQHADCCEAEKSVSQPWVRRGPGRRAALSEVFQPLHFFSTLI